MIKLRVNMYLHGRRVEPKEGDEHEYDEDPSGQLEVLLGLVLAQRGDAGEERATFDARLGQDEEEGADQGQVAEQKLQVPQDAVRDGLEKRRNITNFNLLFSN